MRAAVFGLLSVIGSPLQLAGYCLLLGKAIRRARGEGVSITALSPLSVRAVLNQVGKRHDPLAEKLFYDLPISSALGIDLYLKPMHVASRLSGYEPKFFQHPLMAEDTNPTTMLHARAAFIDSVIDANRADCSQLVLLGAGFDTRAFTHGSGLRVFEVDTPQTQAVKRAALDAQGAEHPDIDE